MKFSSVIKRINRRLIEISGSDLKIANYLRGQGMKIGYNCHFETMSFSTEPYLIELGNHVGIAKGALFITHDGGIACFSNEFPEDDIFGRIIIGNNVIIGMKCILLPNTIIGNNCIVGTGSVVRGKFQDNSVIVGNPAKILMHMDVQKFLYQQSPGRIGTAKMTDPEKKPYVLKHFNLK